MSRKEAKEKTRLRIYETAIEVFREVGFDKATMREIAKRADLSLGATYVYFPSKAHIVLRYYAEHQAQHRKLLGAEDAAGDLIERVGRYLHSKLELLREDQSLMIALARGLIDPTDDTNIFSEATAPMREDALALIHNLVEESTVPKEHQPMLVLLLWASSLGVMAHFLFDRSPDQQNTHELIDEGLETLTPAFKLLRNPVAAPMLRRVSKFLKRSNFFLDLPDGERLSL